MLRTFVARAFAIMAGFAIACDRPNLKDSTSQVVFAGSGIGLTPDDEWKRIDRVAGPGQCPPTLVGPQGILQVLVMPPERSDPQVAAAGLRAAFDSDPNAVKDSFEEESLVAGEGIEITRISYGDTTVKDGRIIESRNYNYLFRNRQDRVVGVNYIATVERDSAEVHEMIRKTLRFQ